MNTTSGIKTMLLTAIAPIVWGSTYIVTTEVLPPNSPLMAALVRALPAGILLVLFARTLPTGNWWWRLPVLGFFNIGFFFYCLFFAATELPGGMAALVMSFQPMLVMMMSWILLSTRITPLQWVAGGVGIIGIGLLVLNQTASLSIQGLLIAGLGTFSMASGVVLTKKWGRPQGMSTLGFTGWQLLFGGLFLLPTTLWIEGVPEQVTVLNYLGYGYLSVVGAMLAYFLWFRGIEQLPTVTVSFLGFLSSVSACLLGYVILDQALTWTQIFGAGAIFISIVLAIPRSTSTTYSTTLAFSLKRN
ncbi:EamA family transporter [Vibrio fujianensis]|uniref:EamA family transporter n=1 Tax=Vibrio fujianensis TaxID=1974215 RepID=UPI000C17015F|nr:EamA family transporter [Vibrio fujianensis]